MLTITTWLAILSTFTIAVISPGPDFLTVLRSSLTHGRTHGYATAAGIALGTSLWIVATIAGLATLLNTYPHIGTFTRLIGATLLLYFGIRILLNLKHNPAAETAERPRETTSTHPGAKHPYQAAWLGFATTTVGNPKAIIFYSSLFASMLPQKILFTEGTILGLSMVAISFSWFLLVATIASKPKFIATYERLKLPTDIILGTLFIGLALLLLIR